MRPHITIPSTSDRVTGSATSFGIALSEELTKTAYAGHRPAFPRFYEVCGKRLFDLLVGSFIFIPAAIVCGIAGLLILFKDGRPILFSQPRLGRDGKEFTIWKLRTMCNSEIQPHLATDISDRRVTQLGRFLRKYRIDELPQIINIIRGDMSFVGPRPEQPALAALFAHTLPQFAMRTRVAPGLTGWAQVNAGYAANLDETRQKLDFDLEYINMRSFPIDIWILILSLRVVITGYGAR